VPPTTTSTLVQAGAALPRAVVLRRVWWPTPALGATALLHAAGTAALTYDPVAWPWIGGGLLANHAVLAVAGFAPRSRLIGPNIACLPRAAAARGEVALTFDDGPDPEVTPRVLDLLDTVGMKGSFFLVGERVVRHARFAREIVERGHAVENHSHRHSTCFAFYSIGAAHRDIERAQAAITDATGSTPLFFRAPFGIRSPLLEPALAAAGLRYVSWTRRGFDTVDRDATKVLDRLTRGIAGGDVLLLHDGAVKTGSVGSAPVLSALRALVARLAERGLRSVTLRAACADAQSG
jgi:peptidoglycan/xylan/chitin deacetylase (PgdA/CDA1 family)